MRTTMHLERACDAIQRKEEIDLENLKKKVFLVHKWSIIRERRKEYEEKMSILRLERSKTF